MELLLCVTLCLLLMGLPSALPFSLDDCEHDFVRSGTQPSVKCTDINSNNNIYWSITVNGQQTRIAECRRCDEITNCPPCSVSNSILYTVERVPQKSTLRLLDNVQNLNNASVLCSSFSNNSQAQCNLKVVREFGFGACQQGYIDVEEDSNTTLRCENLVGSSAVDWNLIVNNEGSQIATCLKCGTCPTKCTIRFARFIAERTNTESKLVVVNPRREDGGKTIQCTNVNTVKCECKIRVVRKAVLNNASVTLHDNWTVTGSASFDSLFTSNNNTICRWYSTRNSNTTPTDISPTDLSTYVEDGRWYFRGKCNFNIELSTSEGQHDYAVEMLPGHGPVIAGMINTERPGKLTTLNNTCPAYVAEGRDVRCQCGHLPAQQGSPPAHVSWEHRGNTISAVLELDNVRRQQRGSVYHCRSVWGAREEINAYYNYTLQVAYGPTSAVINSTNYSDPTQNATLTCTSDDVFPSANFSWSVTCLNETLTHQSSACIITPEVITNETEVVCVVSNSELPDLHSREVFKFRDGNDNQGGQDNPGGVAFVAGGAVGVIVIIAVIAVLVVVCVRRNRKQPEQQELKERRVTNSEEEFEEYINEFYESSDGIEGFRDKNQTSAADQRPLHSNGEASQDDAVVYSNSGHPLPSDHHGDVYAQVVKTTKKTTQDDVDSERQGQDTYAQVQTKPKGDANGQHQLTGDNSADVYMNTSR